MQRVATFLRDLAADDSGAAFIEYTALLGVILAVGIGVLAAVGIWANNKWTLLNGQLT